MTLKHWVWSQGSDLRFSYVLGADATIAGLTRQDQIGCRIWELPDTAPLEGDWAPLEARMAAREAFVKVVLCRTRRDGQQRYFSISGTPNVDPEGHFIGYRGTAYDCTMERIAVNVAQQATPDALDRFILHDLSNQVSAIQGFAQLLRDAYGPELADDLQDNVAWIVRESRKLSAMLDGVRELARLARAALVFETVDIAALARDIAHDLASRPAAHAVVLTIADLPPLRGDAGQLRTALRHLMENAWKFTAQTGEPAVELGSFGNAEGSVTYFVRDNGIGFPANTAADGLFLPFRRLAPAGSFPGVGIGLCIVKHIIERHGGRVWAEGAPHNGAKFTFSLQ